MQAAYSLRLFFLLLSVSVVHPNEDLLTRTLTSLGDALGFVASKYWELNLDGVLGIRIVVDQLQVLLNRVENQLSDCPSLHPLLSKLDALLRIANSAVAAGTLSVSITEPQYYANSGGLLAKGVWSINYPDRFLRPAPVFVRPNASSVDVSNIGNCFAEQLGGGGRTPCNISDFCWKYMTAPGLDKYFITHQLIYLEISDTDGCSQEISTRLLATFGKSVDEIRNNYCYEILTEAKGLVNENYPLQWNDLLFEQITLCGILGYRDFFQIPWVEEILSLQEVNGCYSILTLKLQGKRQKREDTLMDGGCSAHTTAVAMGALVVSIRFMVDVLLATQICTSN